MARESLTRPQQLALRNLWDKMYPDHPYGRSVTEQSLGSIRREELQTFFRKFWTPERMTFSVVGDIEKEDLEFFKRHNQFSAEKRFSRFEENLEKARKFQLQKNSATSGFPFGGNSYD